MDLKKFRNVLSKFATGVTVVSTIDNKETWVFSDKPELMSENKVNKWIQINDYL